MVRSNGKTASRNSRARSIRGKQSGGKRRTIAQANAWMNAHHEQLLDEAKKNCIRLTGRPTFGGARQRKSA